MPKRIILALLVIAFGLIDCAGPSVRLEQSGGGQAGSPNAHLADYTQPWPIQIEDKRAVMDSKSGIVTVTGGVTNTSAKRICWVKLTFDFLDKDGHMLSTCFTYVVMQDQCLSPGQRISLNKGCIVPSFAKWRVSSIEWQD